jgi:hypothetical protein
MGKERKKNELGDLPESPSLFSEVHYYTNTTLGHDQYCESYTVDFTTIPF